MTAATPEVHISRACALYRLLWDLTSFTSERGRKILPEFGSLIIVYGGLAGVGK
jgi:hypothetical protein